MPPGLQRKVHQYRRWQDARASLLGKLLLIEGLKRFGLDGPALLHQLRYSDFGRPNLPGRIDFNISHAGDYVVCAFGQQKRVGIDIEKIHPVVLADFRRQMTEEEWTRVTTSADPTGAFFHYWTQKEAAIKAHGHGLTLPLQEVVIDGETIVMNGAPWPLFEIEVAPDHVCHLVTEAGVERQEISVERLSF